MKKYIALWRIKANQIKRYFTEFNQQMKKKLFVWQKANQINRYLIKFDHQKKKIDYIILYIIGFDHQTNKKKQLIVKHEANQTKLYFI